jgi:hypothetical protein
VPLKLFRKLPSVTANPNNKPVSFRRSPLNHDISIRYGQKQIQFLAFYDKCSNFNGKMLSDIHFHPTANEANIRTKTLITNKCTKKVLPSIVTHSYMFRPCWVIFRENYPRSGPRPGPQRVHASKNNEGSSRLQKQRTTQSTAHSHSTVKCNLSITVTISSTWRWPIRVETCRSVLRLMVKLSLCICWRLVFLYDIVHGYGTHQISEVYVQTLNGRIGTSNCEAEM